MMSEDNLQTTSLSRRSVAKALATIIGGASLAAPGEAQQKITPTSSKPSQMSVFSVIDYGAVADGRTMNTQAIQQAINACAQAGGGAVYLPPGEFLSGPIKLSRNITLYLEAGAVIKGSPQLTDYPPEQDAKSGESLRAGLVTFIDAENVSLRGRGTIEGNGLAFHDVNKLHAGIDTDKQYTRQGADFRNPQYGTQHGPIEHGERPGNLLRFIRCRNVLVEDVTIQNSPTWTVQFNACEDVVVNGVHINSAASNYRIPNDDGMDLRDCEGVRVSNCRITTGDDCIALFASRHVVVNNCTLTSRSAGIRVGFDVGHTHDCAFQNLIIDSNCGLKVNVRGEGSVENILFSDIVIRTQLYTGHWWGKAEPINVSALRWVKDGPMGRIRNIRFSNISAESESGILLYGSPESLLQEIRLEGLRLFIRKGPLQPSYGGNFDLRSTADLSKALFAHDIPGLYFRHVDGLKIRGLDLSWDENLADFFSHGIEGEDFRNVELQGFDGRQAGAGNERAAIMLRNGSGISLRDNRAAEGNVLFLQHQNVSEQRLFSGNDLSLAGRAFEPQKINFEMSGNLLPKK